MKNYCIAMALLACATSVLAQTNSPSAPTAAPKIVFDSTTFNFGRVKFGEAVTHDFIFTNTGNATLEIKSVRPGCGCTTTGNWDKQIEPGKTGVIPLKFNSTGYNGQVGKSATVTCNDPGHSNIVLQITGTVWRPIDVTPQMAMFNIVEEAPTNQTKVVRIINNLEEPVTLSNLQASNPAFQTELKEVKPGKEFELLITATPPYTNRTTFSTITLKTSCTNMPGLSITAYAVVQPAVMLTPSQVNLPPGPLKQPLARTVMVHNNSANPLVVSDVTLDLPGVELKVAEPQTGRVYSISMNFPAGFQMPQGQKAVLTFKSSHPAHPLFKVPVAQVQPPVASAAPAGSPPLRPAAPAAPPARVLKGPARTSPATPAASTH